MIKKYFIWDKTSTINGCQASKILQDEYFAKYTVVFFTNENNVPCHHNFIELLRSDLNIHTATDEEVCQAKLNQILAEQNIQEEEQTTLEEQEAKIELLIEENSQIKQQLEQLTEAMKLVLSSDQIELLGL